MEFVKKFDSPFTPGRPVPPEFFIGRKEQIDEINLRVKKSIAGSQENIFLVGERGIGKSSLASLLRDLAEKANILSVHVHLGAASNLEEMARKILDQLIESTKRERWFDSIKDFFGKHIQIQEIGLGGVSVSFTPSTEDLTKVIDHFPEVLENLLGRLKEINKEGLLIILDDINGLAEDKKFANWYKSMVDEIATNHKTPFPVTLMLIGLPEQREHLANLQPSLMRIFKIIEINKLQDDEVELFFSKMFNKVNINIVPDAMTLMVFYSSGWPILMQEIGDAVFYKDIDGSVDIMDAKNGIIKAAEEVGDKYLAPKVYSTIRSDTYKSILKKIAYIRQQKAFDVFTKREIEEQLSEEEKKVFYNLLNKLSELGVVKLVEKGKGKYQFTNKLYPFCIWMKYAKDLKIRTS